MIGLLATYFVVAYLLIPSGLFRSFYSLFLPRIIKFQRTRLEEFTFAILAAILPFSLALALSWTVCVQPFGVQGKSSTERRLAYRTFVAPAINDKLFLALCRNLKNSSIDGGFRGGDFSVRSGG
jgi:hypothetical protein